MQKTEEFKRGDTFSFYAAISNDDGTPFNGDITNIKCQVRDVDDNLLSELTVASTETLGTFLLTAGSTDEWPVNTTLLMDIQLLVDGVKATSETIEIPVVKDVTRDGS